MDNLYKMLQEIRLRPEIYLGKPSLERLRAFVDGYKHHNNYDVNASDCLCGFNQYVADKYEIHTDHDWSSIIRFMNLENEKAAFDDFFVLLDEFMRSSAGNTEGKTL